VGPEALIHQGLVAGAAGAVSALASAFPRDVAEVVRRPTVEGAGRLSELRAFVERFPRQAALKRLLGRQGVAVREEVRAPLRSLTVEERLELDVWHDALGQSTSVSNSS
jgi:dihydrodipicolinate synthase/N-acetylneuraminate lyase